MTNSQSIPPNRPSSLVPRPSGRSFHHRMARLVRDAYQVKCGAVRCPAVASFVCEWDQQQGKKTVARHKLYCTTHACSFANRHNIYMADLPDVLHSKLETAGRDDWKYGDTEKRTEDGGRRTENLSSAYCHLSSETKSEEC